jgi:hypothetical protein
MPRLLSLVSQRRVGQIQLRVAMRCCSKEQAQHIQCQPRLLKREREREPQPFRPEHVTTCNEHAHRMR